VFNNLFVQANGLPGAVIYTKQAPILREGGNQLWGVNQESSGAADPFAKLRQSPLFQASKQVYKPGLTTNDVVADPGFIELHQDGEQISDLRLSPTSAAIDAGQPIPGAWPDPLRETDEGRPDIGALPLGGKPWGVGVDGRISVLGGAQR